MIKTTKDLLDWAESILCNSLPMSHCSQEEWDSIIHSWREEKHRLFPDGVTDSTDNASIARNSPPIEPT